MARMPRFTIPGLPQHVIQRGNNRQRVFHAYSDYRFFLDKLTDAAEKHECDVHAYVLMSNHVHLLVTPWSEVGISKMMQTLGRYYVQRFNYRYKRTGTLWEGRFKATLVETERYLLACMRYIELNPVRAGMVAKPSDYPWSSYRCNAFGDKDTLVKPHDEYDRLGKDSEKRQKAYQQLFCQPLSERTLAEIRETTNKAWVLGSECFKNKMGRRSQRPVASSGRGGDRKSKAYRQRRSRGQTR